MYARRRQTRSLVLSGLLTIAFLFIFSTPAFSSPTGIVTSHDLLSPGTCIPFRFLPTSPETVDPEHVAQTLFRAQINRTDGSLPIPSTLLVDFPDSGRSEVGDTPVLISFPKQMATELRGLLKADPQKALEHPGDIPFLRELLGELYFQGDPRSSETRGTFPDSDLLVRELTQAKAELRHWQDLVTAHTGPEAGNFIRNMYEAEAKARRLHLLVVLRAYYESALSELNQRREIDSLYLQIGKLNTVLSSVLRDLIIPIGRHSQLLDLEGDVEFGSTRASWFQELDRLSQSLPEGVRYNSSSESKQELTKLNRILTFIREIAAFPADAHEWDLQEKRRRLWGVIRETQLGQHDSGGGSDLSLAQIDVLEAEKILSDKQAQILRELNQSGQSLASAIAGLEGKLESQKASEPEGGIGKIQRQLKLWRGIEKVLATEGQTLSEQQEKILRELHQSGQWLESAIAGLEESLRAQQRAQPDGGSAKTEQQLKRLRSIQSVQNYILVFEHLAAQGFPTASHLETCRKLVAYEAQAERRWRAKDRENISQLRFVTKGYVTQYLGEAQARGIVPKEDTWTAQYQALTKLGQELEKDFGDAFPRLADSNFLQWAVLLMPKDGPGLPEPKTDAPDLINSNHWDKLLMMSARSAELLRGAALDIRPEEATHPHTKVFLEWGMFLNALLPYKRQVVSAEDQVEVLERLDREMTEAGLTKAGLLKVLSGFFPVEEIASQIPERPTEMVAVMVMRDALLPRIVAGLAKFLAEDIDAQDEVLRKASRATWACHDLIRAKPHLEKLKLVWTTQELFFVFNELDQVEKQQGRPPEEVHEGQDIGLSETARKAAEPVVEWYMQRAFVKKHPATFIPEGTHTVMLWLHGMGTNRSTVKTLDSAVDMTPSFGRGFHGVGISAPWHGGPNLPLGPGGLPTRETLRLALQHIHYKVMFFKEKGLRVVVAGRSLNASLLMQYLVDNPGILDGAIAYGGVLPPGFPRGAPKDQIEVNEQNALQDEALRARNNPVLSNIAIGLLRVTDWYERLEANPRLLDPTPTWVVWGRRDQEYKGILDEVLREHILLQERGVRIVPMLFEEGAHQSFNPRIAPTEAERLAPGFRIADYNEAFPAIADLTRLYLSDPQMFSWERVQQEVIDPLVLDPYHMPSHLKMRPR